MELSPEVIAAEVTNKSIVLTLDQPVQSGEVFEFEVADKAGFFHNAEARAEKNKIYIQLGDNAPSAIRYAWKDNPLKANVRSLNGLPMSSFELEITNNKSK